MITREPMVEHFYPHTVKDIREFKEFAKITNEELKLVWSDFEKLSNNIHPQTADERGIREFEKLYGINNSHLDLETRRYAIKAKELEKIRYTEKNLIKILSDLTNSKSKTIYKDNINIDELDVHSKNIVTNYLKEGTKYFTLAIATNFILLILPETSEVFIGLALNSKDKEEIVLKTLDNILPLNLSISTEVLFNTHLQLSKYTHSELNTKTHRELREEKLDE